MRMCVCVCCVLCSWYPRFLRRTWRRLPMLKYTKECVHFLSISPFMRYKCFDLLFRVDSFRVRLCLPARENDLVRANRRRRHCRHYNSIEATNRWKKFYSNYLFTLYKWLFFASLCLFCYVHLPVRGTDPIRSSLSLLMSLLPSLLPSLSTRFNCDQ